MPGLHTFLVPKPSLLSPRREKAGDILSSGSLGSCGQLWEDAGGSGPHSGLSWSWGQELSADFSLPAWDPTSPSEWHQDMLCSPCLVSAAHGSQGGSSEGWAGGCCGLLGSPPCSPQGWRWDQH